MGMYSKWDEYKPFACWRSSVLSRGEAILDQVTVDGGSAFLGGGSRIGVRVCSTYLAWTGLPSPVGVGGA